MSKFPNDGKTIIIDDNYMEVQPLINILNQNGIAVSYFDGNLDFFPESPLAGVRLVFLDLRFSSNTDSKVIVGNACTTLQRIIGEKNGPYMLITWSSTGDDHLEELRAALDDKPYGPEIVFSISKAKYFQEVPTSAYELIEFIKSALEEYDFDYTEEILDKISTKIYADSAAIERTFVADGLQKLEDEIYQNLKQAGLLSLFILWENTIRDATHQIVNDLYGSIPSEIKKDRRLGSMIKILGKNRLEKQFDASTQEEKYHAMIDELNELYGSFCEEQTTDMDISEVLALNERNTDYTIDTAVLNSWKLITHRKRNDTVGKVYIDPEKRFDFFELMANSSEEAIKSIKDNEQVLHILANVTSECDTAQAKYQVFKVVPGIMIPLSELEKYQDDKILNLKKKDYMFDLLGPIRYEAVDYQMFFNVDQVMSLEKQTPEKLESLFDINRKYYLLLRNHIGQRFITQGGDLYK